MITTPTTVVIAPGLSATIEPRRPARPLRVTLHQRGRAVLSLPWSELTVAYGNLHRALQGATPADDVPRATDAPHVSTQA